MRIRQELVEYYQRRGYPLPKAEDLAHQRLVWFFDWCDNNNLDRRKAFRALFSYDGNQWLLQKFDQEIRRRIDVPLEALAECATHSAIHIERELEVLQAIRRLPAKQALAMALWKEFEGSRQAVIAVFETAGWTRGAAEKLFTRAKQALLALLKKQSPPPPQR